MTSGLTDNYIPSHPSAIYLLLFEVFLTAEQLYWQNAQLCPTPFALLK